MSKKIIIILTILVVAILAIGVYFGYNNFFSKEEGDVLGELTADHLEYNITASEEADFYKLIGRGVTEEKIIEIKNNLNSLKEYYPEGYFMIIKIGSLDPDSFRKFYEDGSIPNLSLLIRELVPLAGSSLILEKRGYGEEVAFRKVFLLGDQEVFLELLDLSANTSGFTKYFKNANEFDQTNALQSANPLYDILEGINSNLRGLRLVLGFGEQIEGYSMSELKYHLRRVYHLEIYLKFLKEKHPKEWAKIIQSKETVFIIQKLWRESKIEIQAASQTDLFSNYQNDQKLVFNVENKNIFDELKEEAGLSDVNDWSLDRAGVKLDFLEY